MLFCFHYFFSDDPQPDATAAPDTGETEQDPAADGEADPATVTVRRIDMLPFTTSFLLKTSLICLFPKT